MTGITRRDALVGGAVVAAAVALPDAANAIPLPAVRTDYGFIVSSLKGCERHGNLGDWGPSITGYQQDHECYSGVWMDADHYHEGYRPDEVYKPCQCHPKHCKACHGIGWTEVEYSSLPEFVPGKDEDGPVQIECEVCEGSGWIGEPEHPDDRYVGWKDRKEGSA